MIIYKEITDIDRKLTMIPHLANFLANLNSLSANFIVTKLLVLLANPIPNVQVNPIRVVTLTQLAIIF
jgi:hypothetical protein